MKHNLQVLRYDLELAYTYIDHCDTLNMSEETTETFVEYLANAKLKLLRETQRVSRLLWPETGRPYAGDWAVINRFNEYHCYINTQRNCINWIKKRPTGTPTLKYYVTKWPR